MGKVQEYEIRLKDKFSKNIKNADKNTKAFGASINKIGGLMKALAPAVGVGLIAVAFKNAIQISAKFEKQMSEVKAISGATESQFKLLNKQAEELGRKTVFSAQQAAEGMKFLSMAGFSVEDTMKALPGTLDLAAAGTIDLGKAADIASNVLTQFGLSADKMNNVNDVIVATSTRTNTSIEQLAEGLKYTGTTAKILKMPLEETSAALGVLANAGLQGSMGGTSLNFALLEMSRISSPTAKKLAKLGVVTHDANGQFVGLTNILEQFEKRGIKSTTILDTFGARGGRAMGTLVEAGSDAIKNFTEINKSSEGLAKRIAKMKLDNLAGDMSLLKSASQGFAISLGKRMNPAMRDSVKFATKLINKFEQWVRVSPADELKKESIQAAVLVGKLRNVNLKEDERFQIIEQLKNISPELVKGIDSENISMETLTGNLRKYNQLQAKRIVLSGLEERELKLINKEANRRAKIEAILNENRFGGLRGQREIVMQRKEQGRQMQGDETRLKLLNEFINAIEEGNVEAAKAVLSNEWLGFSKTKADVAVRQLEKINAEAGAQIKIAERIKYLQEQLGIGKEEAAALTGKKAIIGTLTPDKSARKLTSTITAAAPKVININIGKLIETQEIKTTTLKEGAPQIKRMITEALMDALNDTQLINRAS